MTTTPPGPPATVDTDAPNPPIHLEFCDQWTTIDGVGPFAIGREADLSLDDNPYLHRALLELRWDRYWWLSNVGSRLTATVSDDVGAMSAWLAPGATLPLLCRTTEVRFTAGPTTYGLRLVLDDPAVTLTGGRMEGSGATTLRPADLTLLQRLTVLALAEPALRAGSGASSLVPSSQEAATRLGWTLTKFNRQLDATCQKLTRTGVRGLHGAVDRLASGRRARLVEYCLSVRLVTAADLPLLHGAAADHHTQAREPDEA